MLKVAQDTRSLILRIALQLFLQKGYKDVSYQDLIKETGLSKGAIYYYFESKEVLLVAVFDFLVEATTQPVLVEPQKLVKDKKSFIKLFIEGKMAQIESFKKIMGVKSFKLNKLLFFIEAINENEKLKKTIEVITKQEKTFLVNCFIGLQNNNKLPEGKDPVILAECLFWMLQGAEMMVFFVQDDGLSGELLKMYHKTINDFFKII